MRQISIFIFFQCLFLAVHSQQKKLAFDIKNIDKNLAKISDSLFAYKFETSNSDYNIFLDDIRMTDVSLFYKYVSDSLNWPLQFQAPLTTVVYHRHPAFSDYPVVNVQYEAAVTYCNWLTEKYNTNPKRKFNRVEFTLPSEDEWIVAAQAGKSGRKWAISSYNMVNKKGLDLYNYKKVGDPFMVRDSAGQPLVVDYNPEKAYLFDELNKRNFYLTAAKSFYANDFGIYNICGNAAEMIIRKDFVMGGGWNSYGGEITTTSIKKYTLPSPEVGFRVFMRVIR